MGALALALSALAILTGPASAFAAGSISGLVTDGTDPVPGVEVCASEVPEEEDFGCTETDSSGEYTIVGLAAGNYKVEFWPLASANMVPQYFNAKSSWALADQVLVTNGNDTPNVNAVLEEGGWIEGRAIDAVSKAGIDGVVVCAYPIDETGFRRCALTDPSGGYEIVGLATDSYEVVFFPEEGESADYLIQVYKGKTIFSEATPVSVAAGSGISGIDAEMKKGGRITGTVTDGLSGAGIRFSAVCLLRPSEPEILRCTYTNGLGGYSFQGVSPGAYKVVFSPDIPEWEEEDDYFQQFYNAKPSFAQADLIDVFAGGITSGIDAHLISRKAPPAARAPAPTLVAPLAKPRPKPHCHKGQRKVRKRGKTRCVKIHHRKKNHHAHRSAGHGRLYPPAAHRSLLP